MVQREPQNPWNQNIYIQVFKKIGDYKSMTLFSGIIPYVFGIWDSEGCMQETRVNDRDWLIFEATTV